MLAVIILLTIVGMIECLVMVLVVGKRINQITSVVFHQEKLNGQSTVELRSLWRPEYASYMVNFTIIIINSSSKPPRSVSISTMLNLRWREPLGSSVPCLDHPDHH